MNEIVKRVKGVQKVLEECFSSLSFFFLSALRSKEIE